jgi:type VI secretion system protein VasD
MASQPAADAAFAARRRLVLAGVSVALCGCASAPKGVPAAAALPPEPVTIMLTLVARPDVNPDVRGRPSPIAVRMFELRSTTSFESADFFALFEREQATLGNELLVHEQFILKPGETQSHTRTANRDTRFIAAVGGYRDLDRSVWRGTAPLSAPAPAGRAGVPAGRSQAVAIVLSRMALQIEASPGS